MKSPDPLRTLVDHSDPEYQRAAHEAAGYEFSGYSAAFPPDGRLYYEQTETHFLRIQNGAIYRKAKPPK